MKRYILLFYFVLGSINAISQTLAPSPGTNFTRKETVYISGQTTDAQVLSLPIQSKSTTYEYADGLGRPIQTVNQQASPLQFDLVAPIVYDSKGRVSTGYLPYRAAASTGSFRTGAVSEQSSFYTTPPLGVTSDSRPWTNTVYEDSPLDRALNTTKIGSDFVAKFVEGKTLVNDGGIIRKWDIVSGRPNSTTTYPAGSLILQESKDEQSHLTRTYTDWLGRRILTQVQSSSTGWFDTYYVYNDYNELLFIITPSISPTLTPSATQTDRWMFRYEYDEFGRQVGSKKPGVGWVYTIYDKWDRPVLTQDGVQRAKVPAEWTYVKYDVHNRPVITGVLATSSSRASLTTAVAASTIRHENRTSANALGYTITSTYPTNATEAGILSITYYDDYGFLNIAGWSPLNSDYAFASPSGYLPAFAENNVKGLATGSKTKTIGATTAAWMNSVTYYDQYYQPLQTVTSHQVNGRIRTTSQYAFSGEIEKTINEYIYNSTLNLQIKRRFTYDHAGRPLKVYHQINNDTEVMLSHFQYNELGEATDIIHHSRNNGNTYLYKTSNKSTIQGWIDEIHYKFSDDQTVFKENLDYQKSNGRGNNPRFEGLITSQRWKHFGAAPEELYNYSYNTPKRLTAGRYRSKPTTTWISNDLYNETISGYNSNGSIINLQRNKNKSGTFAQIDNLTYTYDANILLSVRDAAPAADMAEGFNQVNLSGSDYFYNENGFFKEDKNKGITSITYNLLDLPNQVNFGSNNIQYTYSAGGDLMTVTYQGTAPFPNKTTHYVGELVFEGTVLQDINHELGRVLATNLNKYQYYLTDHLGSTRVVLQEDPMVFTNNAGLENMDAVEESEQFIGYEEVVRISSDMLNHTEGAESEYSMRLSGGYGENIGLAKSISVMPGDTVRMEVFGKYIDISEAKRNPAIMAVLMAVTAANPMAMGVDGAMATAASKTAASKAGLAGLMSSKEENAEAPPAYLNYLFFDAEMNYKYGGFVQMSNAAREDGTNNPHEKLSNEVVAEEPGYFYIYLSNDSNVGSEAFFDDFSIQVSESFIVQQTDYYPFGLVAKTYTRAGEKATKDLFQGKTYDEITKMYDFHARQYDAALGRWFGADPQDQFASPYVAMGNNPVMMVDPDGELAWFIPIAIGIVSGGLNVAANWSSIQAAGGGWSSFGMAASSFGLGFGVGVAATLAPASVTPYLVPVLGKGALLGMSLGSIGGLVSGFGMGAGNTWLNGGSFSTGLAAGLSGAGTGALIGGLSGGAISGGLALFRGHNFWTGLPKSYPQPTLNLNQGSANVRPDLPTRDVPIVEAASGPRSTGGVSSANTGNNIIDTSNIRINLETAGSISSSSKLPTQIHHFATNKHSLYTKQMSDIAKQFSLDLNGSWNKAALPHIGRHPNVYHQFVLKGMQDAATKSGGSQITFLKLFNEYVKIPVIQNPGLLRKSGW